MKFFVQTLFAIAALVFGFFMGVRYQTRVESVNEVRTLVQVQKSKIESLRDDNQRLKTVVLLREFLDKESIRLPEGTVNHITGSLHEASQRFKLPPEMILAAIPIEGAFDINPLSKGLSSRRTARIISGGKIRKANLWNPDTVPTR